MKLVKTVEIFLNGSTLVNVANLSLLKKIKVQNNKVKQKKNFRASQVK